MTGGVTTPSYLDPRRPAAERVRELLERMTLDEKIAQLGSVWVYELLDNGQHSHDKARALMENGIGQITRIGGASSERPAESARLASSIQTFLREETRLGIPAIVHEETYSGYMARGATCFRRSLASPVPGSRTSSRPWAASSVPRCRQWGRTRRWHLCWT